MRRAEAEQRKAELRKREGVGRAQEEISLRRIWLPGSRDVMLTRALRKDNALARMENALQLGALLLSLTAAVGAATPRWRRPHIAIGLEDTR